jgi:hypothetical protein
MRERNAFLKAGASKSLAFDQFREHFFIRYIRI